MHQSKITKTIHFDGQGNEEEKRCELEFQRT